MSEKVTSVIAREDNGNIQITFTIPWVLIQKEQEETIAEMAKNIEVPGFRKGQAPVSVAREKIPQNQVIEHTLSHILPKALGDAVTENKLKIAIYPKFELISAENEKDWQIRGVTCELPEIELGKYKEVIAGELRAASIKEEPTKEQKENIVIKALIDNTKIAVPQILIEQEADSRISNLLARLEKLGLALESYLESINKKAEDLKAEYATQAREAISIDLILNKIAEVEKIKIDEKEIDAAFKMSQSQDLKDEDPEYRKRLIESILKRRSALDFLLNLK